MLWHRFALLHLVALLIIGLVSFQSGCGSPGTDATADGDIYADGDTETDGDAPADGDNETADGDAEYIEPAESTDCGIETLPPPQDCGACHGAPPDGNGHVSSPYCYRCHGFVVDQDFEIIDSDLHKNGVVDYTVGCTSCHGWNNGAAPEPNLSGKCAAGSEGVGAHVAMRETCIPAHRVNCINCHIVPTTLHQEGHLGDDLIPEITFANLATAHGAKPTWDGQTCSSVYCHGATLQGGTHKRPNWYATDHKASECGACHRLTDPDGNADADCSSCHPTSMDADRKLLPAGDHMNGMIDLPAEGEGETR